MKKVESLRFKAMWPFKGFALGDGNLEKAFRGRRKRRNGGGGGGTGVTLVDMITPWAAPCGLLCRWCSHFLQKSNRKELEGSTLDYVQCPPSSA
ncbi:hypothetical protein RUM44_003117 [Polyplax serrata]|uniref:Uncharacterized protein n=1 Tax=Polyplax serrata TaxID=468196 RepID=A0ABR1AXL1_POLSC